MSPITIPFHLLIPTVVSLAAFIFLLIKRNSLRRKNKMLFKAGLIFFFSYALLVGNALGHDIYYQLDVNRYDLNQDGVFSASETTPAQALAMERLTNNHTRNVSFLHAFAVSLALSASVYLVMRINHALFESEDNEEKNNLNNVHTY